MVLTVTQVFVAGIVASALIVFFRLLYEIAAKRKFTVPDWVMVVIVYVVAYFLALGFTPAQLPAFPSGSDPTSTVPMVLTWLGSLLTYLSAVALVATAFYFFILQKVKDGLGPVVAPTAYGVTPAKSP